MRNAFYIIVFFLITNNLQANNCLSGNCQNGFGIQQTHNNNQYLGEFKNGKKSGQGVYYYSTTIKYVGSWKNDARNGEGRMYINGKVTQAGIWKDNALKTPQAQVGCINGNCLNGIGTYLYKDGRKLYSQFENGHPINQVVCYYPDGQKYIGLWKEDKKNSNGILYTKEGKIISGAWDNNRLLGENKNEQIGCLDGDCVSGEGTYVYDDFTRYNGSFNNGLANGFGVCYYSDGDIYIGEWKNHTFDGYGTMYFNNGEMVEGNWKNGIYQTKEASSDMEVYYDLAYEESNTDEQSKIWVVLIGVSRYTTMRSLKYTDDDAFRLHSFFKSPAGGALPDNQIKILIDEDADKDGILKGLTSVAKQAGKKDIVLFFFSGHGINGSFLPSDYDGRDQVVKHSEILNILESSQAKSKVVIADACHSGSFTTKGAGFEMTLNSLYSAFNNSRGGTLLLLSSKAEETSIESNGLRQGVFSHYLINGLKGNANTNDDEIITVKEVYDYVHANVRAFTNNSQTPVIRGNFDENMPLGTVPF
ncbi:MAG: caspase family protein [Saprospiraceae bacterium]